MRGEQEKRERRERERIENQRGFTDCEPHVHTSFKVCLKIRATDVCVQGVCIIKLHFNLILKTCALLPPWQQVFNNSNQQA